MAIGFLGYTQIETSFRLTTILLYSILFARKGSDDDNRAGWISAEMDAINTLDDRDARDYRVLRSPDRIVSLLFAESNKSDAEIV